MTTGSEAPFKRFSGVSAGAKFYRVDLHVHSYQGSSDVADETMTPTAIVDIAAERRIRLVAVTDHNSVANVGALLAAAARTEGKVAAIPGVEITTSFGHVLVYAAPDNLDRLGTWLNALPFEVDESGEKYTRKPIDEIAREVRSFDGMAIPAHVGRKGTGFMTKAPHRECQAIFACSDILAMEIDSEHLSWFSATDDSDGKEERAKYLVKRKASSSFLGRVLFSDAHSLNRVGQAPNGRERLTRVKMETPSYEALRTALLDPDARVVLEEPLPDVYPRIVGVRYVGGFLDEQEIAFAPNLTALIGGRGAGKSTAIEALRSACVGADSAISVSEAWPNSIQIEFVDEFGVHRLAQRDAETGTTFEIVDGEAVPVTIPLEGYQQDRVAAIVRGYEKDPALLLEFFDQYLHDDAEQAAHDRLLMSLEENAVELLPLDDAPVELKAAKSRLVSVQAQIKAAAATKAHEALGYRRRLNSERELRANLRMRLDEVAGAVDQLPVAVDLKGMASDAGIEDLATTSAGTLAAPGSTDRTIVVAIDAFVDDLENWQRDGQAMVKRNRAVIDELLNAWDARDKQIEARIQTIVEKLREEGVPTDLKALNALARQEAEAQRDLAKHTRREQQRDASFRARIKLLEELRASQDRRTALRTQLGKQLSAQFQEAGVGFRVGIKFRQGELVGAYEEWLRRRIGNRFLRGERFAQFCRALHPIDLAADVRTAETRRLLALRDSKGSTFFSKASEAQEFVAALKESPEELCRLELISRADRPEITLTVEQEGKVTPVPFRRLSFGQKASILLGALLFSDRSDPLVIDQPEDHLDSAFIYEAVVRTLRKVKERRQVIVATHNANIAILGDAELVVPLRSWGGQGSVVDRGSVDSPATRKRACAILEGGEQAYRRRGQMYGLDG